MENAYWVGMNRVGENDYDNETNYVDPKRNAKVKAIIDNAGINDNFDVYAKLFY